MARLCRVHSCHAGTGTRSDSAARVNENTSGGGRMPEQDFELYLSLLSRFLRLKSTQRDEIADELRDHLEARQAELAAHGLSGEEAIRSALDEFGDAAELANHFTRVSHIRKRRLIMRVTFGTITALATS